MNAQELITELSRQGVQIEAFKRERARCDAFGKRRLLQRSTNPPLAPPRRGGELHSPSATALSTADELRIEAPKGVLTTELRQTLVAQKQALLTLLQTQAARYLRKVQDAAPINARGRLVSALTPRVQPLSPRKKEPDQKEFEASRKLSGLDIDAPKRRLYMASEREEIIAEILRLERKHIKEGLSYDRVRYLGDNTLSRRKEFLLDYLYSLCDHLESYQIGRHDLAERSAIREYEREGRAGQREPQVSVLGARRDGRIVEHNRLSEDVGLSAEGVVERCRRRRRPSRRRRVNASHPASHRARSTITNDTQRSPVYEIIKRIEELPPYDIIALDTETTGLERDSKLLGVSFCGEVGKAFWLPADNIVPYALEATLASCQLIMHNAKFDLQVLARNGISLCGESGCTTAFNGNPLFDTMIAHQLLDENEGHGLKHLAKTILGADVVLEQNPLQDSLLLAELKQLVEYACADADYTFQLYQKFVPQLKQENLSRLFHTVEMPLVKIVAQMEDAGILLDTEKIVALQSQLQEESKACVNEIFSLAGKPFDINSPVQLSALLYSELNLESVKKTPKGAKSTNIESLEAIKDAHPIVEKILRYREIEKLLSTYLSKLPQLVNPTTGRIHCQLHQNGTVTGRFSCSEPNLQNIPRGDIIRSAFIPSEGHVFIDADFSQIELRCIAHYTQDENMLAAYHNGADLHKKTIADMLGKPIEDVTEKERFIAKSINFGLAYGMGATALSKRLGVDKNYAQSLMDKYFGVYSKVKSYIHQHQMEVQQRGYVVNMFGRRRRMVHGDYHKAFNALIQSTATDICKIQMVRLAEALPEIVKMVLQVHDELLFEVPKEEAFSVLRQIVEIMETPVSGLDGNQFSVPIKVSAKIALNWGEAK
jgi:DNA polymerase I-like protein with 3'-5' exonuclease and polymerase domains